MSEAQTPERASWNLGRIVGPKPPLKPKHIWAIRTRMQHDGQVRDLAMFNTAIDSKLRGCDLVKLRVSDIHLGDSVRLRTTVMRSPCRSRLTCDQGCGGPVPPRATELGWRAEIGWPPKTGPSASRPSRPLKWIGTVALKQPNRASIETSGLNGFRLGGSLASIRSDAQTNATPTLPRERVRRAELDCEA